MSARRLTGRDFKRPRRSSFALQWAQLPMFALGLAAGLGVAGLIYFADHRSTDTATQVPQPTPHKTSAADSTDIGTGPSQTTPGTASGEGKYDFYQMLPKFEVVVPEKERGSRVAPAAQVDRPGIYFLQVGSYRDVDVADRIHAQLAKLGIDATVQRVAVDADVWHRVRIGPINDLARLNKLRQQLQASDLDSLVIRVDQ